MHHQGARGVFLKEMALELNSKGPAGAGEKTEEGAHQKKGQEPPPQNPWLCPT